MHSNLAVNQLMNEQVTKSNEDSDKNAVDVKALLARLQESQDHQTIDPLIQHPAINSLLSQLNPDMLPAVTQPSNRTDYRHLSFHEGLKHLSRFPDDLQFVETYRKLRLDQKVLEQVLWDEQLAINSSFQSKLDHEAARAAAACIPISADKIDELHSALRAALHLHSIERVLPAWDGLLEKQQTELQRLQVPCMFPTNNPDDRQRQTKVLSVLNDLIG